MTLSERLSEYVRACFTGLWIHSAEPDDALTEIAELCRRENWRLATWDIERGLRLGDGDAVTSVTDPLGAVQALNSLAKVGETSLLVLRNFHRFLGSPEVVQAIENRIAQGRNDRTFVIVLAPLVQIPVELERQIAVIEHQLPGRDDLARIARGSRPKMPSALLWSGMVDCDLK